ncbi:stage III sporulation protein AG [Gorillibacterium sp. sgz5001074]|uniref:stage III sporulation protein AG n=1 Tax=Gorillibacterium sp. sgz5001074 TaxID=3446695 RepID=UPI003F6740BA
MGAWLKKIEELLSGGPGGSKRVKTFRWLILIGLAGCALMILNSFSFLNIKNVDPIQQGASPPGNAAAPAFGSGVSKEQATFKDYEQAYESKLRDILTKIVGVGEVEVMVTIDSTEELQVEKSTKDTQQTTNEKAGDGATRHISDVSQQRDPVTMNQSGDQVPLVTKTIKPKIRGVVVVAKGAENATVKKLISDAVERGLEVPAHRISVIPRKQ